MPAKKNSTSCPGHVLRRSAVQRQKGPAGNKPSLEPDRATGRVRNKRSPSGEPASFPQAHPLPNSVFCCYVGERSALSNPDQRSLESKHHPAACKRRIFGEFPADSGPAFHRRNASPCKCALSGVDALLKACESPKEKPSACTTGRAHHFSHFHFGAVPQNRRRIFLPAPRRLRFSSAISVP